MFSIAAILNKRQKGELYFGVKNDGTVIGQEINDESLRKVSQAIGNHIKPAIYPEIKIQQFGDRETDFAVMFYRHGTQKLSCTAQKTHKRKKGSMRCLNIAKSRGAEMTGKAAKQNQKFYSVYFSSTFTI